MSLFGSLQANYLPSSVQTGRLPTVSDGGSGGGQDNGGDEFLSLIDGAVASDDTSDGMLSMYSALSPELAYRASLIGSMLDDVTNGMPTVDDDETADDPTDDPLGDVTAGAAMSYDAADSEDVTNELLSTLVDNTLPRAEEDDEEVESPIEDASGTFTNALPIMDAPPA